MEGGHAGVRGHRLRQAPRFPAVHEWRGVCVCVLGKADIETLVDHAEDYCSELRRGRAGRHCEGATKGSEAGLGGPRPRAGCLAA
eukprot:8191707-Alexandrium_andersonii.AAC.1